MAGRIWIVVGIALVVPLASGCAGQTRMVEHRYHAQAVETETETAAPVTERAVVEQKTVVKEVPEERGFISGLVHGIGEILALPFRLVGGLIRLIF